MKISERMTIEVGTFEVNCSIIAVGRRAWIVDPGAEAERIAALLEKKSLEPAGILLTHAHFDHVGAVPALQKAYPGIPVFLGAADLKVIDHPMNQMPPDYPAIARPQNLTACDGSSSIDGLDGLAILETPGHTPGGVCYYFAEDGLLLSGDTLFAGSVGRTDFPGGDMATLMRSLGQLKKLPKETVVIPGHGPFTTIERELAGNPFLQ